MPIFSLAHKSKTTTNLMSCCNKNVTKATMKISCCNKKNSRQIMMVVMAVMLIIKGTC